MKNFKKKSNGYIMVTVLVIMIVLLAITFFYSDSIFSEMAIARNQKAATIGFHLAEAGVQEAIWRIQYDSSARNTFLNTTDGQTSFSHNPALLSGGSYNVSIQNTAKGAAEITATGFFSMGLKTAQRKIQVSVAKANEPPPYNYDGAIFTGGSVGEEDITLTGVNFTVTGSRLVDDDDNPETPPVEEPWGSLISNRDIWFTGSTVNIAKDIIAKRNVRNVLSSITVGGSIINNAPGNYEMPSVDVTSECSENLNSYKCKAKTQNQYFTAKEFDDLLKGAGSLTYTGVVYVAGNQGIKIDWNRSVTVNGVLASEASIDVGGPLRKGTLTINHIDGSPSGVITLAKFTAWANSVINITGLVYVGDRFSFDPWYNLNPSSKTITINGGILTRRFEGRGIRNIVINFNQDLINEGLQTNPQTTPVIQVQHWEEEY